MIQRIIQRRIKEKLGDGKAILLIGPRQTGKTTLIEEILKEFEASITLNCDDPFIRENLENASLSQLKRIIGKNEVVFIDEAQRVKNIGITLKLITDELKGIQLLVSGSSALDLANEINEPLTGRKWEFHLFPISWSELVAQNGFLETRQNLENYLIYGTYPDVINNQENEKETLRELAGSFLYKDLLNYKGIRKPEILDKLLRALALQIGQEVSYNELANLIQVDKATVQTYIDLLEKVFVIFRLPPFSRNLRKEISTSRKIYFYDNGIRNSLLANFAPLDFRQDKGQLWENFLISERIKYLNYQRIWANSYFWRTHDQQEIDYLEEKDGQLSAFEFKWNPKKSTKIPGGFKNAYPEHTFEVIHPDNLEEFIE
jgi:predicted AAA+ superfamily ATPase